MLEQKETKIIQELQQDIVSLSERLETQEEIINLQQSFLKKNIIIDKLLCIERKPNEKKCIIHYENDYKEEKTFLNLKDFLTPFPEHLILCNRNTLVNKNKDFFLLEKDKNKWMLSIRSMEIEITKHNFKNIKEAFTPKEVFTPDEEAFAPKEEAFTAKEPVKKQKPMNLRNWKPPKKEDNYARNH